MLCTSNSTEPALISTLLVQVFFEVIPVNSNHFSRALLIKAEPAHTLVPPIYFSNHFVGGKGFASLIYLFFQ